MTAYHLAKAVADTAIISVPTVLQAVSGKLTPEACDARLDSWSRRILKDARIETTVAGLEHAPADEAFVVMSNHQSLYDVPVLFQTLRRRLRMVAKSELFKIPVWGPAMRAAGMVEVDRSDRAKAIASLQRARDALAAGTSIWIAPEGTRSDCGRLGEFKQGGFHLALDAGARILPVSIEGTRHVLAARAFSVRPGAHVRVTVSPPLDPAHFGNERRSELVAAVRRAIETHLTPANS